MKIIFFGASELGFDCCEALVKAGHNIVGIFTIEQEFKISYSPDKPVKNYLFKDFTYFNKKHKLPVYVINENLKDYYNEFKNLNADFLLAIGWYYMIPKKMLKLIPKGGAGIHASLLPKYRGNAPLVWAMINGETKTGVSFFYFADGVDEGDLIAQKSFSIEEDENIKDALLKVKRSSIDILTEYIPRIADNTAPRVPQDHTQATIYPKRSPEDGQIDWNWDSKKIYNFIRAQTRPYPGAFTYINGKKVTIWDATIYDE